MSKAELADRNLDSRKHLFLKLDAETKNTEQYKKIFTKHSKLFIYDNEDIFKFPVFCLFSN
jgi:hypothetical protein